MIGMQTKNLSIVTSKRSGYVFIDASNLWAAQKIKGKVFDFQKLKSFLVNTYDFSSIQIYYYTAYPKEGTRDYSTESKHKFYYYLNKALGIKVVKKELKQIVTQTSLGEVVIEKGNMDVEMAIDCVHHIDSYDTAIFFTGDSDFLALVNYIKNKGKDVYIYSSKNNISRELKTGASGFFDILKIEEDVWGKEIVHKNKNK